MLYNARAMLRDYEQVGDALWERFNVGRDGQLGYYRQLADAFRALTDSPMANELADVVGDLSAAGG